MRSADSRRSWWQTLADFVRALDEMADDSPLAARVAQLEKRLAKLEPASRDDGATGIPSSAGPDVSPRAGVQFLKSGDTR